MNVIVLIVVVVLGLVVLGPVLALLAWISWELIVGLLAAMLIGYVAGHIMSGRGYGPVGNVLLGLGGGFVGNLLIGDSLGVGPFNSIVVGVIGAVLLVWLGRVIGRR